MKTLADWGITYDQSSQWQRLASVSKAKFEEAIAQTPTPSIEQIIGDNTEKPRRQLHPEHDRSL